MYRLLVAFALAVAPAAAYAQHDPAAHGHARPDSAHAAHECTADGCPHHEGMDHGAGHAGMGHAGMRAMHHPATHGAAETPAHAAVRAAVTALFDAMRAGDGAAVRAAFHPDAALMSVGAGRDGALRVQGGEVEGFATAVGTPHDAVWDERIGPVEVRVDGPLATAWMPYRFYLGDTFSHCGVNAFQLADTGAGWQIVAITDTRRATCDEFPAMED